MADPIKLEDIGSAPAPVSTSVPAPVLTSATAAAASVETTGGLGNIFTQAQAKKEDSKMITSIISQKDVANKTKSILGAAPTLEKSIEQSKEASLKRKVRLVQFAFLGIFVAGLVAALYFYTELAADFSFFGANTTQRLADTNANLRQVQTLINKHRYMSAQFKLNELSYEADRFLSNVANGTVGDAEESQKTLPALLTEVRADLTKDLVVPTVRSQKEPEQTADEKLQTAQQDLRTALQEEKKKYGQHPTESQDILDVKLLDNTVKLVGNTKLLSTLQGISADAFQKQLADYAQAPDAEKLKALQDLIGKILVSTKSDLATISDIKHARIEWSAIIGHIKEVTLEVRGSNFDQPAVYERSGGVTYNGYEFDTNSNKIVLSGTTKTFDGSNFTLMSNLIDTLENSEYFQDVEMRSFSKSKTGNDNASEYAANFKIDLNLETANFSPKNKPLTLESAPVQAKSGANRDASVVAPVATVVAPVAPVAPAATVQPAATATPFSASAGAIFNSMISPSASAPAASEPKATFGGSASAPAPTQKP